MVETAAVLADIPDKRMVLTGALSPARFKTTDAVFNVGMAVAAVQTVEPGVYIAMSGQVFPADAVKKNREENRFERKSMVRRLYQVWLDYKRYESPLAAS